MAKKETGTEPIFGLLEHLTPECVITLRSRDKEGALKELVAKEDGKKPLSDEVLVKMLNEQGYKIARRTVAKYRKELGILPSHLRKSF